MAKDFQRTSPKKNSESLLDSPEGRLALLVAILDEMENVQKLNIPLDGEKTAFIRFSGKVWKDGELVDA